MRIAIAKEVFNRKISLFTSKINIELGKKLVRCLEHCFKWLRDLYTIKLERKYLENFEMWCWRKMEKIKWSEKVTNEQFLERIVEKRTLINNILHRKANLIGHILRRNCLLHDATEGQMTE
jgi:hypothetical protein